MCPAISPEILTDRKIGQYQRQKERKRNEYGRREAAKILKLSPQTLYEWDIELASTLPPYASFWASEKPLHPYQFGCLYVLRRLRTNVNRRTTPVAVTIQKHLEKFTLENIANELSRTRHKDRA
ncbi:MAG: hypothetical protein ACM37W_24275 [Actinomycetota bacterium]